MSGMSPTGRGAAAGAGSGALIGTAFLPGIGSLIGAGVGALAGGFAGYEEDKIAKEQGTPTLKNPTQNPAADPAKASTTAIQNQLSKEQNARAGGSLLTAPSGLIDEPTTTGSLLTGA